MNNTLARGLDSLRNPGARAGMFWRWWSAEINAMLPPRWRDREVQLATWDGQQLQFYIQRGGTNQTVEASAVNGKLRLDMAAAVVLRRSLQLPLSARFRLHDLLNHEIAHQCPIDPKLIVFTYQIIGENRSASQLSVSLAMIRRSEIASATAALDKLGLSADEIWTGDHSDAAQNGRITIQHGTWRPDFKKILPILLICAAMFMFSAAYFVRISQQQAAIYLLQQKLAALQPDIQRVQVLRTAYGAEEGVAASLRQQRDQPAFGAIMATITNILPDGTWLTSMTFDGHTIELQGYSSNAAGLVAVFDGSKLFINAAFRAPMTPGPQPNLQQFDLAMSLAPRP